MQILSAFNQGNSIILLWYCYFNKSNITGILYRVKRFNVVLGMCKEKPILNYLVVRLLPNTRHQRWRDGTKLLWEFVCAYSNNSNFALARPKSWCALLVRHRVKHLHVSRANIDRYSRSHRGNSTEIVKHTVLIST